MRRNDALFLALRASLEHAALSRAMAENARGVGAEALAGNLDAEADESEHCAIDLARLLEELGIAAATG